jgi:hydrogenase maturation protease
MNMSLVKKIADSVLYEGYLLYPYRASAVKNRQRFNFGVLMPEAYSVAQRGTEAWCMQTECIISGNKKTRLDLKVRFLHLLMREVGQLVTSQSDSSTEVHAQVKVVESLEVRGRLYQTWQEAIEREADVADITIDEILAGPRRMLFWFPSKRETEPLRDDNGKMAGVLYRDRQSIEGSIEVRAESIDDNTFKITVEVQNLTQIEDAERKSRDDALMYSLASAHTIMSLRGGQFVSLLDPPEELSAAVSRCENTGTFPVLVGNEDERDQMLSSPIILYDYPKIAEESAGDLFDSTEIDEILTLRILTMTDEEKREMRYVDEHARRILERTESLPSEQLMKMHGAVRGLRPVEDK